MGAFVPVWLVFLRCEATHLGVFDLWVFCPTSNNRAVPIRVGLELAEPAKTKRGREEGDGTEKCHKLSQIVVTFYGEFYDNL